MTSQRPPQKRRIETRNKLIEATKHLIEEHGYEGLRVEDIVARANVAKGTFFSHFDDKETVMSMLIGQELKALVIEMSKAAPPQSIDEISQHLRPLGEYLAQDRLVFDLIVRHSGALSSEDIGDIAENFGEQVELFTSWIAPLQGTELRSDVSAELLGEGVQAFLIQAISLQFCALHSATTITENLDRYLHAWLIKP